MHWTNLFHSLFPFLFSLFLRVLFFFGTFFLSFDGRKVAANCEWIKYIRSRRAHFFITSFVRCFLSVFLSLLVDCGITVAMSQWTLAPVFYGKSAGILLLVKKIWELSERTLMNVCCVCVCVKCSQPMTKLKIKWNATQSHIKLIIFNEAQNQNSHTHTHTETESEHWWCSTMNECERAMCFYSQYTFFFCPGIVHFGNQQISKILCMKNTWHSLQCSSIPWNFRFHNVQTYFAYHFLVRSLSFSMRTCVFLLLLSLSHCSICERHFSISSSCQCKYFFAFARHSDFLSVATKVPISHISSENEKQRQRKQCVCVCVCFYRTTLNVFLLTSLFFFGRHARTRK